MELRTCLVEGAKLWRWLQANPTKGKSSYPDIDNPVFGQSRCSCCVYVTERDAAGFELEMEVEGCTACPLLDLWCGESSDEVKPTTEPCGAGGSPYRIWRDYQGRNPSIAAYSAGVIADECERLLAELDKEEAG